MLSRPNAHESDWHNNISLIYNEQSNNGNFSASAMAVQYLLSAPSPSNEAGLPTLFQGQYLVQDALHLNKQMFLISSCS